MQKLDRSAYAALAIAVVVIVALVYSVFWQRLQALSTDILLAARHAVYGPQFSPQQSDVVVVAFDENTYRTSPFKDTPHALWTPQVAAVTEQLLEAKAKVVGFDVIFSTSMAQHIKGFDTPLLKTLRRYGPSGQLLLGMVQHSQEPILPHASQRLMVGGMNQVMPLNMRSDIDDVIRSIPLWFERGDGTEVESMALALAARANGQIATRLANGDTSVGDYQLTDSSANLMHLNFQGGRDIPTASFADLYHCLNSDQREAYFAEHFADNVVILGSVLDLEDRKLTSKRFMTDGSAADYIPSCSEASLTDMPAYRRDTIPGVYILATAVNNILQGAALEVLPAPSALLMVLVACAAAALITAWLTPLAGPMSVAALAFCLSIVGVVALQQLMLVPWLPCLVAMLGSYGFAVLYRYATVDRQKQKIRELFSLYLEPGLVDEMVDAEQLPELGGETREVTIWFSDLANFTNLSEGMSAQALVDLMNRYFSLVTDTIEAHGGFVDKYIGDAVVAVFGAPHHDIDHAFKAVDCALKVQALLAEQNQQQAFGPHPVTTRIGINTGEVVVGNVGSSRRFNYTVMGDAVNLASRLEGANKMVGSILLVSEATASRLDDRILLADLGKLRVKGKTAPTRVYEPLVPVSQASAEQLAFALAIAKAQQAVESKQFDAAKRCVSQFLARGEVESLLNRITHLEKHPPPENWDGVAILETK